MDPYRVFLTHGGADTWLARETLKPRLEESGAEVFLDNVNLEYGDDFREIILSELRRCDELLALLTPSSIRRPWVYAEIGAMVVREQGDRVIAVQYGPEEQELQELGVLSLLGTRTLLPLDDFDTYLAQLKGRVESKHA
ncbi:hypothetical protein ABI59_12095 [Acidobacteria bacterium Mor1]|nr:hypothetical protein ABI59_12095 [Acidobacteria bacterium Mor1]